MLEACSQARCTPPSWATESSPYSKNTFSYSSSARCETDGGVDRVVAADVEIADELVEEQPPQALRAAAVAGEQRALHHLGQVDEGENRPVEIGEVPPQDVGLVGGELLGDVDRHERPSYGRGPSGADDIPDGG